DRIDLLQRALRFRIEAADGVDLLVEQLDAIGFARAHREDVDQRATHGEVSGFVDLRHVAIAAGFQPALLAGKIEVLTARNRQTGTRDVRARRQPLHQRRNGYHQYATLDARQSIQCGDALRNDVWMRTEQVVGQG